MDVLVAGPSKSKSPGIEGSFLESLRDSLDEEITSEIKILLVESQKEMLKLLNTETRESIRENTKEETENGTRSFYTPTRSVRTSSTQNNDPNISPNRSSFLFVERFSFFSFALQKSRVELKPKFDLSINFENSYKQC